jgi:hypothetical protein
MIKTPSTLSGKDRKKGTDSGLDRELALVLGEAGQNRPQQLRRRRATAHLGEQRLPSRLKPRSHFQSSPLSFRKACSGTSTG